MIRPLCMNIVINESNTNITEKLIQLGLAPEQLFPDAETGFEFTVIDCKNDNYKKTAMEAQGEIVAVNCTNDKAKELASLYGMGSVLAFANDETAVYWLMCVAVQNACGAAAELDIAAFADCFGSSADRGTIINCVDFSDASLIPDGSTVFAASVRPADKNGQLDTDYDRIESFVGRFSDQSLVMLAYSEPCISFEKLFYI